MATVDLEHDLTMLMLSLLPNLLHWLEYIVTTHVYPQPSDVNKLPNSISEGYNLPFGIPIIQPLPRCSWIRS